MDVTGNTKITGTAIITGDTTIKGGDFQVFSPSQTKFKVTAADGNTEAKGSLHATGSLSINSNKFTVSSTDGYVAMAGTTVLKTQQNAVTHLSGHTTTTDTTVDTI